MGTRTREHPIVDLVVGARPNLVKLAPVWRACKAEGRLRPRIVHTGQHYDDNMNRAFFDELRIPRPEVDLQAGPGPQGAQTARILESYEVHLMERGADATVVFGDVNSTLACALAAAKLGVPVAHVEAGLRSFDRTMPEEINRVLTDAVAALHLTSESSGVVNLEREGVPATRIRPVGNVMIDTLMIEQQRAIDLGMCGRFGLEPFQYGLVTLHRPNNVDDPRVIESLLRMLVGLSRDLPLVFPVHPRTRQAVRRFGLDELLISETGYHCLGPLSYRENLGLMKTARLVMTDSGGMQEETTVLGIPCLTLRENTERPVTVELGTSRLVGNQPSRIRAAFEDAVQGNWPRGERIPLWDGRAGERVARFVAEWLLE